MPSVSGEAVNELSLFSGAGGGLLATKHLLDWNCIGYVENEPYCQEVLKQRIADGFLDAAPIFGNIRTFISEGYAEAYQGMVDVITAGFPCQPFSVAGKQKAEQDERNMWPSTLKTIRTIRPRYAFLENVPGLLAASHGYFGTILSGLAEAGYDAKWTVLGADDVGGSFQGKRLFVVAPANSSNGKERVGPFKNWTTQIQQKTSRKMFRKMWLQTIERNAGSYNGMAHYLERGRAIGNGQVPAVVALAWKVLT